jgi:hypothetical protein
MSDMTHRGRGLSRRQLLERAGAAGAALVAGGIATAAPHASAPAVQIGGAVPQGAGSTRAIADLVLVNGRFVDGRGLVATTVTVRNGRIAKVGEPIAVGPDARTIDLGGRTVIPGLFDAHVHFTRAGVNPGYEARRIERAFSIAELQEAIARRATSVPPGGCITCIGGWNHTQFAERGGRRARSWTRQRRGTRSTFRDGRRHGRDREPARGRSSRARRAVDEETG